ncbi:electron transporter RnfG [Candidatus Endobugula sertula]|uniref:Ion-translocating oxidoreductase complex subunit G n=1 Tax=Candidatus Endobugula sertula TaxID=62101 RepID=A0A1D2QPB6_9GAMM|nr:electron transporter RnfG [Candidatus Endobugula sertula]
MMPASISKNSLLLFVFALITAVTLGFISEETKDKIAKSERNAAKKALLEIIPPERFDNDPLLDTIEVPLSAHELLGNIGSNPIHIARKDNHIIAVIIPTVAPDGYTGDIKMIVGINTDGTIAGVRVLAHKETPGLGDKVDIKKSQWITHFTGRSLNNPTPDGWTVKKNGGEFDQFTGATITPRAVVKRLLNVLKFVDENQTLLFPKNKSPQNEKP